MAIKNHNFRFNEEKEAERKAWQILHSEEVKEDFRSQNEFVIAELSQVLRDAGYANAAEFFTELFAVREEKRKYEEACKVWQEECVRTEIEATGDGQYYGNVPSIERGRTR